MKDLILAGATIGMFVLGYFIMKRIDQLIAENQRLMEQEQIGRGRLFQIAAETPMLFDSVAYALESCSKMDPYVEFAVSSGNAGKLLRRLEDGSVDLVLLTEDTAFGRHTGFEYIMVPYYRGFSSGEVMDLPVRNLSENTVVYVLWNQAVSSRIRDRVLSALRSSSGISGCA